MFYFSLGFLIFIYIYYTLEVYIQENQFNKNKKMSTRAQIRFATREEGVTFNEHPPKIHAQFYRHSDGYPEGLGVEIAESLLDSYKINNWELEYLDTKHADLEYIYYVWQTPGKTTWISIFAVQPFGDQDGECIFVGEPQKLLSKYNTNTNYDR